MAACCFCCPIALTGALVVAYVGWVIVSAVYKYFFRAPARFRPDTWAVVTGAAGGIGSALCTQVALRGLNVVLVDMPGSPLEDAAAKVRALGRQVRTVEADFAGGSVAFEQLRTAIADLKVSLLVNNAGVSYDFARFTHEVDEATVKSIIAVNVVAVTHISRILVEKMAAQGYGCIVNVSSAAGTMPSGNPLYSLYSASKAYIDFLGRSMHWEYASKGVRIQTLVPFFVATRMSRVRRPTLLIPSPEVFARACMRFIGHSDLVVYPYLPHLLEHWVTELLPVGLTVRAHLLPVNLSIRKRGLEKVAAEQAGAEQHK